MIVFAGGTLAMLQILASTSYWIKTHHLRKGSDGGDNATKLLAQAAQLRKRMRVLDIASGAGDPAITLAENIGPEGRVIAIDLVLKRVCEAKQNARIKGLNRLNFLQADAQTLPFSDHAFDVITCRFGAIYFPDVEKAMEEALRYSPTTIGSPDQARGAYLSTSFARAVPSINSIFRVLYLWKIFPLAPCVICLVATTHISVMRIFSLPPRNNRGTSHSSIWRSMSAKSWTILPTFAMTPTYSILLKVSLVRLMTKSAPISPLPWRYSTSWTLGSFGSTALSSGWRSFTSLVIKSSFSSAIYAMFTPSPLLRVRYAGDVPIWRLGPSATS